MGESRCGCFRGANVKGKRTLVIWRQVTVQIYSLRFRRNDRNHTGRTMRRSGWWQTAGLLCLKSGYGKGCTVTTCRT